VNHAAVAVGDRIFSFGGYCTGDNYRDERPIDVFVLNTTTLRWTEIPKPADPQLLASWPYQRYGHTVVAKGDTCYLFGGRNDEAACNLLFTFCTNTYQWSRPVVEGDIPGERDGHSAAIIGWSSSSSSSPLLSSSQGTICMSLVVMRRLLRGLVRMFTAWT
jgi:hypothetical protein